MKSSETTKRPPRTGAEVLRLKMPKNDAGAATVRDYLKALLERLWEAGEGFSGKRPFGNSGWELELRQALLRKGVAPEEADQLIFSAIASL